MEKESKRILRSGASFSETTAYILIQWLYSMMRPRRSYGKRNKEKAAATFFTQIEPALRDARLFWLLFRYLISELSYPEAFYSHYNRALKRFDRLSSSLQERQSASDYFRYVGTYHGYTPENQIIDSLSNEVRVFRGSLTSRPDRVRMPKPLDFLQDAGAGYSYSLRRETTIWFADWAGFMREDGLPQFGQIFCPRSAFQFGYTHHYEHGNPTVSEFRIKKDKIVLVLNELGEEEIFARPTDVKLVRYQFVTSEEIEAHALEGHPVLSPAVRNKKHGRKFWKLYKDRKRRAIENWLLKLKKDAPVKFEQKMKQAQEAGYTLFI